VRYAIDTETRYRELREALLLNTIDEEPTKNRSTPGTSATGRGGNVAVTESVRDPCVESTRSAAVPSSTA